MKEQNPVNNINLFLTFKLDLGFRPWRYFKANRTTDQYHRLDKYRMIIRTAAPF